MTRLVIQFMLQKAWINDDDDDDDDYYYLLGFWRTNQI